MDKLKSLTRFRESLVRQRSRHLVEVTNVLNKIIPEFKPFFKYRFSATALYIFSNYTTPEKIANMNARSYEIIRKLSRGKFSISVFVQLKTLAKNTVGQSDDYLLHEIEVLLEIHTQLDAKIQEIEEQVITCIRGINPPMLSIPGIGALSAAIILSEYGDLSKYDSPAKLLSFAGLEPGYFQSGQSEHFGRMVKHGSSHPRYALMNCCLSLTSNEPAFAE